jgi:hypothetical protein
VGWLLSLRRAINRLNASTSLRPRFNKTKTPEKCLIKEVSRQHTTGQFHQPQALRRAVMEEASINTKAWYVNDKDFPTEGSKHDQLQFVLQYAVLAPSFYNSQPWRFSITDSQINVCVNKNNWLRTADPEQREFYISAGCALENLLIALEHFNMGHQIAYFPERGNDEWVARVKVVYKDESSALSDPAMFKAIAKRHTNHHRYDSNPITKEHLHKLANQVTEEDIDLEVTTERAIIDKIYALAAHGDTILFANKEYRDELKQWIHESAFGKPWFLTDESKLDKNPGELAEQLAQQEAQIVTTAPMLGILTTDYESPMITVKVGQIFEKISLESALRGIRLYPLSQIIEIAELRDEVQKLLPSLKGIPQMIFSLGYAEEEKEYSPRQPVAEVMV